MRRIISLLEELNGTYYFSYIRNIPQRRGTRADALFIGCGIMNLKKIVNIYSVFPNFERGKTKDDILPEVY